MLKQMIALTALMMSPIVFAQNRKYVIMVHGGVGATAGLEGNPAKSARYYAALDSALMIGDKVLPAGGKGPEAVIIVINYFEGNLLFNAGIDATCTAGGAFELDASIMEGKDLNAGAVAGLKHVEHPINTVYAAKTKSPYVMLSGAGAEEFAKEQGLEMVEDSICFATPKMVEWIEKLERENEKSNTVGCVALDKQENLTTGTSTGGVFKKRWGRVGDSPVIGTGTYADSNSYAVSCMGHDEYSIHHAVALGVCARYKYPKESVERAADYIIHTELNTNAGSGGLTAVDKLGNITMSHNSGGVSRGSLYKEKDSPEIKKGCDIRKKIVVVGEK